MLEWQEELVKPDGPPPGGPPPPPAPGGGGGGGGGEGGWTQDFPHAGGVVEVFVTA